MADTALETYSPDKMSSLTDKFLRRLEDLADSAEPMSHKDLREITFGLLDRRSGAASGPGGVVSDAVKGAVLGAMSGMQDMAARIREEAGLRDVTPKDTIIAVPAKKGRKKKKKEVEDGEQFTGLAGTPFHK